MKPEPSKLDQFLNSQAKSGEVLESRQSFTLAREKALQKIAEYQLPFANAWVVKLIQSAVAGQTGGPIRMDIHSSELRAYFDAPNLTIDLLERQFYNPEPYPERSVRHLLSALWAIGLREKCAFQLVLPREEECLVWDGESLHRATAKDRYDCLSLSIALHPKTTGAMNWVKKMATSGARRAEILKTALLHGYTCPVPLTVDGRRVDSLYLCPTHGQTSQDFPLTISFGYGDLQPLTIPPGTFEAAPSMEDPRGFLTLDSSAPEKTGGGLSSITKFTFQKIERTERAAVPALITAHREWVKKGDSHTWQERSELPKVYWVQDGVIVDEQLLGPEYLSCTAAVFLNAEGLETDLTSFHLTNSPERAERVRKAKVSLIESLRELTCLEKGFAQSIALQRTKTRLSGGGLFLLGVATFWVNPWVGAGMVAAGGAAYGFAGSTQEARVEELKQAIGKLESSIKLGLRDDMRALKPGLRE